MTSRYTRKIDTPTPLHERGSDWVPTLENTFPEERHRWFLQADQWTIEPGEVGLKLRATGESYQAAFARSNFEWDQRLTATGAADGK